MNCWANFRG